MVFMLLLLLLIAAGIVFDGFDIGVGLLLQLAPSEVARAPDGPLERVARHRQRVLAAAGPGAVLRGLSPRHGGRCWAGSTARLTCMALGMVLRSVAFEFRIRASTERKPRWVLAFWVELAADGAEVGLGAGAHRHELPVRRGLCVVRGLRGAVRGGGLCAAGRVLAGDAAGRRPAAPRSVVGAAIRCAGRRWAWWPSP